MSSSSARADAVRFFGGFIWDRLPRACLPVPLCLSVSSLLGTPLVMSSFQSSRLSSRPSCSSSPLAPSSDTIGGEGCLLGLAVPFMSARRGIIRTRFSSHYSSPRLLAYPVAPYPSILEASPSIGSDCGGDADALVPIPLGYPIRSSVPFMLAPPNRHEERGERRGGLLA